MLIAIHAAAASIALLLGAAVLLRRTKGDQLHRMVGRVWGTSMYVTLVTSFGIRELRPGHVSLFHALSIFTLCTLTLGIRAARRGEIAAHRRHMRGSYVGLLGAFVGAVAVPQRFVPQLVVHRPLTFVGAVLACLTASTAIIALLARVTRSVADDADGARHHHDHGVNEPLDRQHPPTAAAAAVDHDVVTPSLVPPASG